MVQDRNKLPIYQLIFMPSSNSTIYSQHLEVMMTSHLFHKIVKTQKIVFLQFYEIDVCNVLAGVL